MKLNPILLEIFKNRFSSIAEEMGITLYRTAFSPNIKERKDFSCAIFNSNGEMVAQAAHIPVHLGSMPMSVKAAIESVDMQEEDMVILNDPYKGGTHLPDITLVAPIFCGHKKPQFFVANRAHHADVGGMSAGSMPLSTSIFQEGIIIPPLKIVKKGGIDQSLLNFFLNNVRTPYEREGDITAQIMSNITGIKRISELVKTNSLETVKFYADEMILYSEQILRKKLLEIQDKEVMFEDVMDSDGIDSKNIKIAVKIIKKGDSAVIDFSESSRQVKGSINAVYSITLSAVLYVFRSLIKDDIPTNVGLLRPLEVITKKGTIVDAKFPASVAGGNVETSQRIVDVLLGALSEIIDDIPAASQGTMNNITIGGINEKTGDPFTYYETIGGGMGGSNFSNGESAIHSHMTNTLNTPIEAFEFSYPMMVEEYSIRKNSGGLGRFNGGDGIIRKICLLNDAEVTVLSERRVNPPYGVKGGQPGKCGENVIEHSDGHITKMGDKFNINLKKGDKVVIKTPGGGGYG